LKHGEVEDIKRSLNNSQMLAHGNENGIELFTNPEITNQIPRIDLGKIKN
jgi:hypothetical protein